VAQLFAGGGRAAAPGAPLTTPNGKGRGNVSAPFFDYISIISIPTHLHRQVLLLYFLRRFIGLRGKSPEWGLDKISGGGQFGRYLPPAAKAAIDFAATAARLKPCPSQKLPNRSSPVIPDGAEPRHHTSSSSTRAVLPREQFFHTSSSSAASRGPSP